MDLIEDPDTSEILYRSRMLTGKITVEIIKSWLKSTHFSIYSAFFCILTPTLNQISEILYAKSACVESRLVLICYSAYTLAMCALLWEIKHPPRKWKGLDFDQLAKHFLRIFVSRDTALQELLVVIINCL